MLIPAYLVAIFTGLAGIAWLMYAISQRGRYQANVLIWLSLPFFALCVMYLWFTVVDVSIDIRAIYARFGIMSIAVPQAIILFILSIFNGGTHGRRK